MEEARIEFPVRNAVKKIDKTTTFKAFKYTFCQSPGVNLDPDVVENVINRAKTQMDQSYNDTVTHTIKMLSVRTKEINAMYPGPNEIIP